jgi:hypothetical protein
VTEQGHARTLLAQERARLERLADEGDDELAPGRSPGIHVERDDWLR